MIILLGMIISILPYHRPQHLYMGRLSTLRADIANGVFTVLRDNLESNGSTDINNGVGLTTSEILVLTSYTFEQVQDIPAFILVTLYGRCDADYLTSPNNSPNSNLNPGLDGDDNDNDNSIDVNDTSVTDDWNSIPDYGTFFVCQYRGPDYLFDYRTALSSVGLDIVLEYAYGAASPKQTSYDTYIGRIALLKQHVLKLFFATVSIQGLISVLTIWYYYIKGRRLNVFTEQFLTHVLSFLSLFVFIAGMISFISLLWINYSMQKKIAKELLAFGFSYHVGRAWTAIMIFWIFFVSISCLVWSGLEWCVTTNGTILDGDGETFFNSNENNGKFNASSSDNITSNGTGATFIRMNGSSASQTGKTNSSYLKLLPNRYDGSETNLSSTSAFTSTPSIGLGPGTQYRNINTRLPDEILSNDENDSEYELQSIEFRSSGDSNIQRRGNDHYDDDDDDDDVDHYSIQKIVIPSSTIQF